MKQFQRTVSICLLTVLSAVMSTATFACPTLSRDHASSAGNSQAHVGIHWHNKGNPTRGGGN